MSLPRKHSHRVVKNITPTLHTLIQPLGAMSLFVNWDRKGLATTVIHRIDKRNIELLRMLRQMVRARHSYSIRQHQCPHLHMPDTNLYQATK